MSLQLKPLIDTVIAAETIETETIEAIEAVSETIATETIEAMWLVQLKPLTRHSQMNNQCSTEQPKSDEQIVPKPDK